jgi:hypothetical protein
VWHLLTAEARAEFDHLFYASWLFDGVENQKRGEEKCRRASVALFGYVR